MFLMCLLTASSARADARRDAAYEAAIAEAVAHFSASHWSEARALFLRAHEIKPSARTLRGLGVVEFELGHYAEAYRLLGRALSDPRRPLAPAQRSEAQRVREHLRPLIAEYRILTTPSHARLTLDGTQVDREPDGVLVLQAGEHTLTASAPGHVSREERVVVQGGESRELTFVLLTESMPMLVELDPATDVAAAAPPAQRREQMPVPARASRAWAWTSLAVGGTLTGLGATLLVLGLQDVAKVEQAEDGTAWSSLERAHGRAPVLTGSGIALTALGLGGTGFAVWMLRRGKDGERAPLRVALAPRGVLLSGAY